MQKLVRTSSGHPSRPLHPVSPPAVELPCVAVRLHEQFTRELGAVKLDLDVKELGKLAGPVRRELVCRGVFSLLAVLGAKEDGEGFAATARGVSDASGGRVRHRST